VAGRQCAGEVSAEPSRTYALQTIIAAQYLYLSFLQAENDARVADESIAHDAAIASVTEAAPQVVSVQAPASDSVGQGSSAEVAAEQPVSDVPIRVFKERFPFVLSQRIEFSSFCPATFVDRDALLLPGNPQLGFVLFQKRLYSFACESALQDFMAAPSKYIQGVLDSARTSATLINFLALGEHFPANMLQRAVQGLGHVRATTVAGDTHTLDIQTELHPVASNIDRHIPCLTLQQHELTSCRDHCWNEWELRRRALQMTNVRTHLRVSLLRRSCTLPSLSFVAGSVQEHALVANGQQPLPPGEHQPDVSLQAQRHPDHSQHWHKSAQERSVSRSAAIARPLVMLPRLMLLD
jgi:hypothetical protein